MVNASAVLAQRSHVHGRAVALVPGKAVLRVLLIDLHAPAVAVHFGQDGGGRDGGHQRITLDNGLGGDVQRGQPVAIDQNHLRLEPQAQHGAAHGQQRGLQSRGPVANLAAMSATLGEALELFRRHSPVMSECENLRVEQSGDRVRIDFLFTAPLAGHPLACEYSLSSALCWGRQMSGTRLMPLRVGFRHRPLAGSASYRQILGCPVRFGEPLDYIEMTAADMRLPLLGGNDYIKGLLLQRVSDMQAQLPSHRSLRQQVQQLIELGLIDGALSVEAVARRLHTSRQTLHRHLRERLPGILARGVVAHLHRGKEVAALRNHVLARCTQSGLGCLDAGAVVQCLLHHGVEWRVAKRLPPLAADFTVAAGRQAASDGSACQ